MTEKKYTFSGDQEKGEFTLHLEEGDIPFTYEKALTLEDGSSLHVFNPVGEWDRIVFFEWEPEKQNEVFALAREAMRENLYA